MQPASQPWRLICVNVYGNRSVIEEYRNESGQSDDRRLRKDQDTDSQELTDGTEDETEGDGIRRTETA